MGVGLSSQGPMRYREADQSGQQSCNWQSHLKQGGEVRGLGNVWKLMNAENVGRDQSQSPESSQSRPQGGRVCANLENVKKVL